MKLKSAEAIAKYLNNKIYYTDVAILLRLFNAPKVLNDKRVPTYSITTEQADRLKKMIMEMREVMNDN